MKHSPNRRNNNRKPGRTKKRIKSKKTLHNREYQAWINIKKACYSPHHPSYKLYGAEHIYMCDRWKDSFENFLEDMGPKPEGKRTGIRRIDSMGDFTPENCQWVIDPKPDYIQDRDYVWLVQGQEFETLRAAAEELGPVENTLVLVFGAKKIRKKKEQPEKRIKYWYHIDNERYPTLEAAAKQYNVTPLTMRNRFNGYTYTTLKNQVRKMPPWDGYVKVPRFVEPVKPGWSKCKNCGVLTEGKVCQSCLKIEAPCNCGCGQIIRIWSPEGYYRVSHHVMTNLVETPKFID